MVEVGGNQRQGVEAQHALHRAFGCGLQDFVDFVLGGVTAGLEGQVNQRNIDGGNAYGEAIELALQFRQHQTHGLGGTGLGGDHVFGGGTGAAQVLVTHVGQHLVVGKGVDGGHQALGHANGVVQCLGHRCQAVGGAGSVGHHGHGAGQHIVVHAVHDGGVNVVAARGGNQHLLGTGIQVNLAFFLAGEGTGTFQYQVYIQGFPRQFGRIAGGEERNLLAVDQQVFFIVADVCRKTTVHGVELGQVGVGGQIASSVDGNNLEIVVQVVFVNGAQNLTANTAVAVDRDANGHTITLPESLVPPRVSGSEWRHHKNKATPALFLDGVACALFTE